MNYYSIFFFHLKLLPGAVIHPTLGVLIWSQQTEKITGLETHISHEHLVLNEI